MISDDKIKKVDRAITWAYRLQNRIIEDIEDGTMPIPNMATFSSWLAYEGILVTLKTQKSVLESIRDTDRITTLAYRVALISLGASLISIVSNFI